ncbi:unnamed protein product [Pseudo-nitzschia multistriata]|uniref:AB hydrolase-1 domain-containing protein n=1 Tax=Pseudo-nitzschia multistriata TaxID=183589 RepID=A0A448YWF6_9STRA|nr:unnamed protein product [Pseudo-nitzschia multistriata]
MTVVPSTVSSTPPLANYGILTGQLFLYAGGRAAFESASASGVGSELPPRKKCILLGGLSDGLLPVPYTGILEKACHENDWSLVQPVLSSSYLGFGHGSLDRDCSEIEELMKYLCEYRNAEEFALVGHSTGCQDAVHFLQHAGPEFRKKTSLVALQAPVSDREGTELEEGFPEKLQEAQKMVSEGRGDEMLPRSFHWAPVTAQRYVDLHSRGGRDDFFSSDYTDAELEARLSYVGGDPSQHPGLRVLVAFSGADEYVPEHVDRPKLTERLVVAMNAKSNGRAVAESLYLETGNHNLSEGPVDAAAFVQRLSELFRGTE